MNEYINYDLPGDTESKKMLWLAAGFANSAHILVQSFLNGDDHDDGTQGRVINHLCRHATELYLKGAVGRVTGKINRSTHNLHNLYSEYEAVFGDMGDFFFFDFPVDDWAIDDDDLFPDTISDVRKSHDQRFRYPADNRGIAFVGFRKISFRELADMLEKFSATLNIRAYVLAEHGTNAHQFLGLTR